MDQKNAKQLVIEKLAEKVNSHEPVEWLIIENETIEKEWGWVFFYQSRLYMETNNFTEMLTGNAPYIVNKHTGDVVITGTAYPLDFYIQEYEKQLRKK